MFGFKRYIYVFLNCFSFSVLVCLPSIHSQPFPSSLFLLALSVRTHIATRTQLTRTHFTPSHGICCPASDTYISLSLSGRTLPPAITEMVKHRGLNCKYPSGSMARPLKYGEEFFFLSRPLPSSYPKMCVRMHVCTVLYRIEAYCIEIHVIHHPFAPADTCEMCSCVGAILRTRPFSVTTKCCYG